MFPVNVNYPTMRVVGQINHPQCTITLFYWNNKYLIKLEAGPFEQTFKISEWDIAHEDELRQVVSEEFVQAALARFESMAVSLQRALKAS